MRILALALLLAGTSIAPAMAAREGQSERVERLDRSASEPNTQIADRGERGGGWQGGGHHRGGGSNGGNGNGGGGGWRQSGGGTATPSTGGWIGRGGGDAGGWRQRSAPQVSTPTPQVQAPVQRTWNGGGNPGYEGGGNRWQRRDRTVTTPTPVPGGTFDRNANGRVDRTWDRNRNGVVDRQWDRNRDGNLDRRWDRNGNGNLDRRWDRNNDERLDRRWDRNRNGRVDHYGYNRGGRDRNDWNRSWRNDRRYDWNSYRNYNRDYYRLPRYVNPYGYSYGYRRFNVGFYLDSLFYSSAYWLDDPWSYRLPPAYGSYRWVRYYDDVMLIDMRTGFVVDVIYSFFW